MTGPTQNVPLPPVLGGPTEAPVSSPPVKIAASASAAEASQLTSANTGWNHLTNVLANVMPAHLRQCRDARRAIRRLVRTGR